jgi:hypothetical protein
MSDRSDASRGSQTAGTGRSPAGSRRPLTAGDGYTLATMREEVVLEAEAVEETTGDGGEEPAQPTRLPQSARRAELEAWRDEVKTAAIAAAGGLVAGAATVAAVRAVRAGVPSRQQGPRRLRRRRSDQQSIIASRSFLVDVHILGSDR